MPKLDMEFMQSSHNIRIPTVQESIRVPASTDNIFAQIEKLRDDARITQEAHLTAKGRKTRLYIILGFGTIIFNVLIATGVIDIFFPDMANLLIKAAAVLALGFAATQTLLSYPREVERHSAAAESFGRIYRRVDFLIAEAKDESKAGDEVIRDFREIMNHHLAAIERNKSCTPNPRDYVKARRLLKSAAAPLY
jgi:hypothetical protein